MNRNGWMWFAALTVIVLAVCLTFSQVTSPEPYAYDESDYMYAGTQGFQANYLDRNGMSLAEFIRKGLELARDKGQRTNLSQYVRERGDISFYRHYHGPLYAYWISMWQALGVQSEAAYRATGLILHGAGALAMFWLFLWVFPDIPQAGAFVAALMFAMNRTALATATEITQHIMFEFFAILSLFAAGQFLRTRESRWWHFTAALLACAFAAVEISIVLIAAVLISISLVDWRSLPKPVRNGLLSFGAVVLLLWPLGILTLNALKGYLYLAYMSLSRKTFSPIGPMELWGFKLRTYPLEFVLPLLVLIAVVLNFRKVRELPAAIPMAVYSLAFLGVTMFVTLPYTHYHGSLMASMSILTGIVFGELWRKQGNLVRWGALGVIALSLLWLGSTFYRELATGRNKATPTGDVLAYLKTAVPAHGAADPLYVPFEYVPALHFYRPDLATVGYDVDWSAQRLAEESLKSAPSRIICATEVCEQLRPLLPEASITESARVNHKSGDQPELLAVTVRGARSTEK